MFGFEKRFESVLLFFSRSSIPCFLATFWIFAVSLFAADDNPRAFAWPPGGLAEARSRIASHDPAIQPAFRVLMEEAQKALEMKPVSVVDKKKAPPSGDKHDFASQAPYFWPDPTKKDGLPYIRKDGQRNPQSYNSDSTRLDRMAEATETLALAYYLTGKTNFADRAIQLIRVWFFDPATRMNPNFEYAQAVPGINTGRGTGMIESRSLTRFTDAVGMLRSVAAWKPEDEQSFEKWIATFLDWALTSPHGKDESSAKNNHGSFYDSQVAHLALFLGKTDLARGVLDAVKTKRIEVQIKPDGSQPLELERVSAFGYSRFNLLGLFELATLGQYLNIDLWHYRTSDGASIKKALDFLLPYVEDPKKPWPYSEKKGSRMLDSLLWQAASVYQDARLIKLLKSDPEYVKRREALFFRPPQAQ